MQHAEKSRGLPNGSPSSENNIPRGFADEFSFACAVQVWTDTGLLHYCHVGLQKIGGKRERVACRTADALFLFAQATPTAGYPEKLSRSMHGR
jgi:hypothetical protein